MKRMLVGMAALLLSPFSFAQNYTVPATTGPGGLASLGYVTGTGQIGSTLSFTGQDAQGRSPAATYHTIQYALQGTPPKLCTLSLDGSLDGINWVSLSGPLDCTTASMTHYGPKPVGYIRVSVSAFTTGDATTKVYVMYARGAQ